MTDHLLFNGIIIDLNIFEEKLLKFNYIDRKIIYNKKNLLGIQSIKKIFNLDYKQSKPLLFIFNQDKQILKNIYRFLLMQWKLKRNLLETENNVNFKNNLNYFYNIKKQRDTNIILDEINYFINQDDSIKQKLIYFIINTLQRYYKLI